MRTSAGIAFILLAAATASAQSDREFSGSWRLNAARSRIRDASELPGQYLTVTQSSSAVTVSGSAQEAGPSTSLTYPLNGTSNRDKLGDSTLNSVTKWEGSALLVNTIVSGPNDYSVQERWEISRDRSQLTITRTIVQRVGESESVLVYDNPNAPPPQQVRSARQLSTRAVPVENRPFAESPDAAPQERNYVIGTGYRLLLRLTNSVSTKTSGPGDRVYLQTAAPVFVNGRLVIRVGSYVTGTISESQRAGRVKGKSSLNLRFESVTLPNGVSRNVKSRAGNVDTRGNLDRTEGRITGESNKGGDARTVAGTTAAGTGLGAIVGSAAGHLGAGAGIGAAAGALGGLAGIMGSRGPDVVLAAGTTMELVLDRELSFSESDLLAPIR